MKKFGELTRAEQIKLFEASLDDKTIQLYNNSQKSYMDVYKPNWSRYIIYRVAPSKPSINWDHVHSDYIAMAADLDGEVFLYKGSPKKRGTTWGSDDVTDGENQIRAEHFTSFTSGDCDWSESLVTRPEQ